MTEETRKIIDEKIEKISKYKEGDKFVVEIRESGYPYSVVGERRNCSEEFLDSLDRLDSDYINEHFGELQDEAYNQGLNEGRSEAWELARYINGTSKHVLREIFDVEIDVIEISDAIFNAFTPQEALAKLKAYEEAQSKAVVGDVVKDNYNDTAVVLDETESYYSVFTSGGCVQEWSKDICKMTGKHIDIQQILSQIGGE